MKDGARIIGLTGQSGAGKTTVSRIFAESGFDVINADIIARQVTEKGSPCLCELSRTFGDEIILRDGTLDRKLLGSIVFSCREKLDTLDRIIYPYIIPMIDRRITELAQSGSRLILLDAPTLFEAGADALCDLIVSVTADKELRADRITVRDNISRQAAYSRFAGQHSSDFFREHSDIIIENDHSPAELFKQAEETANRIKESFNVT